MRLIKNKLLLILLFPLTAFSQINFENGDLQSAFRKAGVLRKPLFIMIHADGCPHCEHFLETFAINSTIGTYYNTTFVNYKLEVNSEDGRAFRQNLELNVMSTPLLTFWQADSTLLAVYPAGDPQNNETSIMAFAARALDSKANWPAQKQAFREGYRQPDFLVNLAYLARYTSDENLNIEAMQAYGLLTGAEPPKDDGFMILQKVLTDDEHPLFMQILNRREEYYTRYGREEVNQALENVIMWSLHSERAERFSFSKLKFMQAALKSIGVDELSIAGRFFMAESGYYFRNSKLQDAIKLLKDYCQKRETLEQQEADFLKKYYNEHISDPALYKQVEDILTPISK